MTDTEKRPHAPHLHLTEDGGAVTILDQTLLPGREVLLALADLEELVEAIAALRIRGAPALGIFAGYALYVLARKAPEAGRQAWLEERASRLRGARPTAVNLGWALDRMLDRAQASAHLPHPQWLASLRREAEEIHREDMAMCRAIARNGLGLLRPGDGLLTHCNAGALATSALGTGLGPILLGQEQGYAFRVYSDETRPLLQGARLTAWELQRAGVDVTLICDSMAAAVMAQGRIQAVLVGCDRVAANGDVANKVGTLGVAVLARYFKIPFYVLGPTSTVDLGCPTGAQIPIEERPGEEIAALWYSRPMAPEGVKCYNPAFDVTPASLVTAIVTEQGVCRAPYGSSLAALFGGREGR